MLAIFGNRKAFYQWDSGQKLLVTYDGTCEVHFRNPGKKTALTVIPYEYEGKVVVDVPNILLQNAGIITAYVYNCVGDECTINQDTFNVIPRQRPADYVYVETDTKATPIAELEKRVNALSEEIEAIKEEGGISGGTSTTASGTLIMLECDEDSEIVVDGETDGVVTLVHCNRNLIPAKNVPWANSGITFTPNTDGSYTLSGTCISNAWPTIVDKTSPIHMAAGSYTLSTDGLSGNLRVTVQALDNSFTHNVSPTSPIQTFTISQDVDAFVYFTIRSDDVYQNTVYVQMESGGKATPYALHDKQTINSTLPVTLTSYGGKNHIYTESGDMLTATAKKSVDTIINEAVKNQLAVDWSAYGLPMLYLTGDTAAMTKDDAVDLAYTYKGMNGTASVKWQGSSSLAYPKKNYTIKFDRAFEAKEGWGEQTKYCFKANFIDHSHARNVCSCKLWGEIVKSRADVPTDLSSLPNGGAVDGYPCIIMLNGEFHGLYTWNIPKDGWMFGSPKAILCADAHTDATRFKALATLNGDFELEYVEDESNTDWVLTSINTAIQAVMDGDLDAAGQYIDIPSAIDYYIHTVDENADDGVDKNYILVTFDGAKWYFSAYDRDTVYGLHWNGKSFTTPAGGYTYATYAGAHALMKLIYDNKAVDLKARAVELRDGIKSEANVAQVFSNFICGIPSQVLDEDARKWPTIPSTSASNLAQILNWYRLRRAYLDPLIDAMA